MTLLEGVVLGVLQGLTEFLPVSSSGHLSLAGALFGLRHDQGPVLEVALHVGTAFSIVTVYRKELRDLLVAALPPLVRPAAWGRAWREQPAFRLLGLLALSAIPVGVVGLAFRDPIKQVFDQPRTVSACLVVTGLMLALTRVVRPGAEGIGGRTALVMGLAQAVALLPGISRSGATISAGIAAGSARTAVGSFSFLMVLAPILGAAALELRHVDQGGGPELVPLLVATAIAYAVGVLSLAWLRRVVSLGRIDRFAPYCVVLGLIGLVFA